MIIPSRLVACSSHLDGRGAVQSRFGLDADLLQRIHRTPAELLIVIHHQHFPVGQDHVGFLAGSLLQIQHHMEL